MIQKLFIISVLLMQFLSAKECSSYYNPEKFYDAPELLIEFIKPHIQNNKLFNALKDFNHDDFIFQDNAYLEKKSFMREGEYTYPINTKLWKYTTKKTHIDEINISRHEIYRFKDEEIANSINDDFENYWMDFTEDAYQMQLTPEQTLFRYNGEYFTFSVFIYGVKGDATPIKGTVVNFWFKNYTNEVNEFIQCNKENNGSR